MIPPTIGPVKLRNPPSSVMNTISPENGQYRTSGVVSPLSGTQRMPASPVKVPEMRNDIQRKRRIRNPRNAARVSLSRIACSALPKGEWTISHISTTQIANTTST
jgi:hypothetical protein